MTNHLIIGVHITDRAKNVTEVQALLSQYGCSIKTRIGLHDAGENHCSPNGLILLEMCGDAAPIAEMEGKLKAMEGVEVDKIQF